MTQKTKFVPDLPEADFARLAAFIDGEGHISICKHRAKWLNGRTHFGYKMKVEVGNTDPRLMIWLRRFVVGSFYLHNYRANRWRKMYHWTVRSREAVQILEKCLPYFVMKRDQAELAIAFASEMRLNGSVIDSRGQFVKMSDEKIAARDLAIEKMKALRVPSQDERLVLQ